MAKKIERLNIYFPYGIKWLWIKTTLTSWGESFFSFHRLEGPESARLDIGVRITLDAVTAAPFMKKRQWLRRFSPNTPLGLKNNIDRGGWRGWTRYYIRWDLEGVIINNNTVLPHSPIIGAWFDSEGMGGHLHCGSVTLCSVCVSSTVLMQVGLGWTCVPFVSV